MPTYRVQRQGFSQSSAKMKRPPTSRSTAVYDFNEGDVEPYNAKKSKVLESSKGKHCNKGRGENDRNKGKDQTQRRMESMHCRNITAKDTNADDSSSASDTIETDDSESESNQARRQLDMRFGGADGVSSSGIFKDENHVVEGSREIVMYGEELWFSDGKYRSPDFVFTADAIELRMQRFGIVRWRVLDIKRFSAGLGEKGLPFIELELSDHGVEILQQHLGHSDDQFCHTIFSTISNIDSFAERVKQITSLSDRYRSIWKPGKENVRDYSEKSVNNIFKDRDCWEEHLHCDCNMKEGNKPSLDKWFDLIYPTEDDRDAVTVTRYDFLLLDPDQFLSDTIIDFYIKYLQNQVPDADRRRLYFYNSFFFRKLTEINKNLQNGLESSKLSFERVKRWTAGINIFDKDYLFIPIMQNAHWSLAIICHPGYLSPGCSGAGDFKAPVILHLDSLEGFHTCVKEPIESYLVEAWRERNGHNEDSEILSTMKLRALKVPQQTNYTDCGLFLLHYVELFIKEVLETNSTDFASYEWFNPAEASSKRAHIQSLIQDLKVKKLAGDHVKPHHLTDTDVVTHPELAQRSVSCGRNVCHMSLRTDPLPDNCCPPSHYYVSLDDSLEHALSDGNLEDSHVQEANNLLGEHSAGLVNGSFEFNAVGEDCTSKVPDSFANSSMDARSGVAFCCHYDDERIFEGRFSSVGIFSEDKMSCGHVVQIHTSLNGSLAEQAGKDGGCIAAMVGSREIVRESKERSIDLVRDARTCMEGKEMVLTEVKDVERQYNSDYNDQVGTDGFFMEVEVQPVNEAAAVDKASEERFPSKMDSTTGSTDCLVSSPETEVVDLPHCVSSSKGLISKAGKTEKASQRRNKHKELASIVRPVTRSLSKGKI